MQISEAGLIGEAALATNTGKASGTCATLVSGCQAATQKVTALLCLGGSHLIPSLISGYLPSGATLLERTP